MRPSRLLAALLPIAVGACASLARPGVFVQTRDPLTRTIGMDAEVVLESAAAAVRAYGFEIPSPAPGTVRVYSEPVTIQSSWRGKPVAERVLCGVGTAASSDPLRLREVTNAMPVELRLGFELEPRQGSTATRLIFEAQGRRSGTEYFAAPTMACTLTVAFVEELFANMEEDLSSRFGRMARAEGSR